ncbi:acyloxyacyl hydrolase [Ochrobactrum sp. CM-21-5]|nr:acyloxyacyl hydrolase [Ochrobactrum sp. CM-21-5]MBC2885455.1 acyloxyacyl hydrolase [Ochrobactrum sp. CM-21-5]
MALCVWRKTIIAILAAIAPLTTPHLAIAENIGLHDTGYFGETGIHSQYNEIRFGVLSYDTGLFTTKDYDGAVINGEFLFRSPDMLSSIGSPRPYIGFDAAIADDPVHFVYGGLNWDFRIYEKLYLTTSFGGAVTTASELHDPDGYKALGCRVLFHLGVGLGYDFNENWTAQLYADHFSNANICKENNGAEAAGFRLGYRF